MTKTQSDLHGEIDSQLPTNHTHAIPAGSARQVLHDIVDNFQVTTGRINTSGAPADGSKYLAGDNTWKDFVAVAGGGGVSSANFVSTLDIAKTVSFPSVGSGGPQWIMTQGYHSVGDYGGALYERISSLPAAPLTNVGTWSSADGAHWIMRTNSDQVWVSAFGAEKRAFADWTFQTQNWQAFEDCKYWMLSQNSNIRGAWTMRVPPGTYHLVEPHSIQGGVYNIKGCGRGTGGQDDSVTSIRAPRGQDAIIVQRSDTYGHEAGPGSTFFDAVPGSWTVWGTSPARIYNCTIGGRPSGSGPTGTGTGIVNGTATFDYVRDLRWSETLGRGGDNAVISDLMVFGDWDRGASSSIDDEDLTVSGGAYHSGIVLRARARIDNVWAAGWPGHGIAIVANGDPDIRGNGNANEWSLNRIASYYNGHAGIMVGGGGDSNAGVGIDIDTAFNRDWGIDDRAFLLNTWVGVQSAWDGVAWGPGHGRYFAMVNHNGYNWLARCEDVGTGITPNYHDEPGEDGGHSWTRWSGDGTATPGTDRPAWDSTTRFAPGGAFRTTNINCRGVWHGVYIEGGTNPASWAIRTTVWGGIMGGNYDTTRNAVIYEDGSFKNQLQTSNFVNAADGLRAFSLRIGSPPANLGYATGVTSNIMDLDAWQDGGWTFGGAGPPAVSVTASIGDQTLGGVTVPVLTVTAITAGHKFAPGSNVAGAGVPARTQIARQINATTGATVSWTGGTGSYALSKPGTTVSSEAMDITSNITGYLDWVFSVPANSGGSWGFMGQTTQRRFGRTNPVPGGTPWMPRILLGEGTLGQESARMLTMGGAPGAGDYGEGDHWINRTATSGQPWIYRYESGAWISLGVRP